MRLCLPIAILTLAALSGYTSFPCSTAQCLSINTGNVPQMEAVVRFKHADSDTHAEEPFLTRDSSETMILQDPYLDNDDDGVINLLDLHPNDPSRWLEFSPVEAPEEINTSGPLDPRELETGSDDHPLLL